VQHGDGSGVGDGVPDPLLVAFDGWWREAPSGRELHRGDASLDCFPDQCDGVFGLVDRHDRDRHEACVVVSPGQHCATLRTGCR